MTFGKCYEEKHEGKAVRQEFNRTLRMFLALKLFSQGQLSKTMWEKREPGSLATSPAFHFLFRRFFLSNHPTSFLSRRRLPNLFLLLVSECIPPRAEKVDTRSMFQHAARGASRQCRIWACECETSQHLGTETRAWLWDNTGHGASKPLSRSADWLTCLIWDYKSEEACWRRAASGMQITCALCSSWKAKDHLLGWRELK